MKKTILSALIVAATGFAGITAAQASDGTIHFTGNISDTTCSIDQSSQNETVDLGTVAATALTGSAGLKASPTSFSLNLSGCPDTVTGANVKFDGTSDSADQTLLALDTDTGAATGLGIQIADKNGTAIPLHTASSDYTLGAGTNVLDFVARYVSTADTVTSGTANATSEFTINYK